MEFEWINIRDEMITQELLDSFESGNSTFDEFLKKKPVVGRTIPKRLLMSL